MIRENKVLRLKDYDYSQSGYYYITLLIKNRECIFGKIENETLILNEFGMIAKGCWEEIPEHFDDVSIDAYIIMPNHIHGIICLYDPSSVECNHAHLIRMNECEQKRQYQKIPTIIGSFKSSVTRKINELNRICFKWHKSYYDHIVRDDEDLTRIREYILNNPLKWNDDDNNTLP